MKERGAYRQEHHSIRRTFEHFLLTKLSRKLKWASVIAHRPSVFVRPKKFSFFTSSPEPLDGFWCNLVRTKYSFFVPYKCCFFLGQIAQVWINFGTHGKVLSQGMYIWNMKALPLLVRKLWPRLKFFKRRSNIKVKVTRSNILVPTEMSVL